MESAVTQNYKEIPKPVVGIRTDKFKYFRSLTNPEKTVNLYDLENDPLEDNNLAEINLELVKDFEKTLSDLRQNKDLQSSDEISLDEKTELEEELKKLGYI